MTNTLTVNWHILENCNYACKYCYALYMGIEYSKEMWKRPEDWKPVLKNLAKLPQLVDGEYDNIRLNIAGGEPLLLWKKGKGMLNEVLKYAHNELGYEISIITNGSLVDDLFIEQWGPKLSIVGVSMDTFNMETNAKMGRCGGKGKKTNEWTTPQDVADIFAKLRAVNPSIECKLNTVVTKHNYQEDLTDAIELIAPDRWKVFQMLPVADYEWQEAQQQELKIDREQYMEFVATHEHFLGMMNPEDNDAMTNSYLMIEPMGRFYSNTTVENGKSKHIFSEPLYKIALEEALYQMNFISDKFKKRYGDFTNYLKA